MILKHITSCIIFVATLSLHASGQSNQSSDSMPAGGTTIPSLPQRDEPRTTTTGTVPHIQIGIVPVSEVNAELFRRVFALPGVENRATIVSLPGGRGIWLDRSLRLVHPEAIVSGREFAHIHIDGSLHAPLPFGRALEVAESGWGERHPWADQREGWDGLVMLFTPRSMQELDIIFQLIVESYNFVTGDDLQAAFYSSEASESVRTK